MIDENETKKSTEAIERFLGVIKKLREPDGCPWDKEQTPLSMRRDLIEEAFEAVDAITSEDSLHAKEELGDVFLNAMMISYMYEQSGKFSIAEEVNELTDKLIRRHPHVFPNSEGSSEAKEKVKDSESVLNQWDRIKANVEGRKGECILDEVPAGFPPILKAYKYQKKAGKLGFDWQSLPPVVDKVKEELAEVNEAWENYSKILEAAKKAGENSACEGEAANENGGGYAGSSSGKKIEPLTKQSTPECDQAFLHVEEEIGDLLFAVVNYARKLGVDPEVALNRTNQKFYRRFSYVQKKMQESGIPMDKDHLKEEDNFWNEAKNAE